MHKIKRKEERLQKRGEWSQGALNIQALIMTRLSLLFSLDVEGKKLAGAGGFRRQKGEINFNMVENAVHVCVPRFFNNAGHVLPTSPEDELR